MKILHLAKLDPRAPGGIERFVRDLAEAQRQRGHEVQVLASKAGPRATDVSEPGLTLVATYGRLSYLPISLAYPFMARRLIRRFSPDIVHAHWPNPWVALALALPGQKCRLVLHWHADVAVAGGPRFVAWAYRLLFRRLERRLLEQADMVIVTSQAYADASPALAPWRSKWHVVPIGLEAPVLEPTSTPPSWPADPNTRVIFIGRLVPYKGVDVLLRALARAPSVQLLVLGDGPERGALERLSQELDVAPRVRFVGTVAEPDKRAWLAGADALCLPSINRLEAFGIVLIEANQAGVPVLVAEIPGSGVGEVARQLDRTSLFPPGDVTALAQRFAAVPRRSVMHGVNPSLRFGIDAVATMLDQAYHEAARSEPT